MKKTLLRFTSSIIMGLGLMATIYPTMAQTTSSHSPYSQFGLGQMREDLLPQHRSMGGISTGVRYLGGLPTLNVSNPAAYSAFNRTIFDVGMYGNITQLGKGSSTDHTADFAFSHITLGIPLAKAGGVALGLVPFSDIGYNNVVVRPIGDQLQHKNSLSGEGGLNKVFFGYGFSPIKGLSIGANAGLIFGSLLDKRSVEFPSDPTAYNTVYSDNRYIKGATFDYGIQYFKPLGNKVSLTVGYSGSLNNKINNETTSLVTITQGGIGENAGQQIPLDTIQAPTVFNRKINLPLKHNIGFTLSKGYNWTFGADFRYADWSYLQTRPDEPRLGRNIGFAVGGQIKPDPTSTNYLNIVDYRLGFRYNQTQVTLNNRRINDMAITAGIGLPLSESNFGRTFSSINISAEFGQQGTLNNNLVRERYINLNLGFTINDSWFMRRNYD